MLNLIALVVVVCLPVWAVQSLTGLAAGQAAAVAIVFLGIGIVVLRARARMKRAQRRAALVAKYGSETEADKIMSMQIWTGMTSDQLVDCLGRPEGIDQQVSARKQKEVWKYHRIGQNRYRNRITVEQGRVVGWTAKQSKAKQS